VTSGFVIFCLPGTIATHAEFPGMWSTLLPANIMYVVAFAVWIWPYGRIEGRL